MSTPLRAKPLRVLITGVTRTIGRQLADELYYDQRVERIIGTALGRDRPYYFRNFDPERFNYQSLDLNRPRSLADFFYTRALREAEINTVVHLAFKGDPWSYGGGAHQLNIAGTKNFLQHCLDSPSVTQFVYLSSASVYRMSPLTDVLIREEDDLNFEPDAHPIVKDAVGAELLCRAKMDHERCNIVVLRPSGVIGRNVSSELNHLFESALCFVPMGFDPMINPIHALDVIRALKAAVFQDIRGVYNIAGPDAGPLSAFLDRSRGQARAVPAPLLGPLYRMAQRLRLSRYNYELNPLRLCYPLVLDSSRAQRELGFSPRHHVKFG
jgi:UDP-glucose 4-epimerase